VGREIDGSRGEGVAAKVVRCRENPWTVEGPRGTAIPTAAKIVLRDANAEAFGDRDVLHGVIPGAGQVEQPAIDIVFVVALLQRTALHSLRITKRNPNW